jgi:hypothetical protein
MHGIVDEKTDVFAYGVLLLEIITGRRAVDSSRQSLVMWVRSTHAESLVFNIYPHVKLSLHWQIFITISNHFALTAYIFYHSTVKYFQESFDNMYKCVFYAQAKPLLEANNAKELADPRLGDDYDPIEMKHAMFTALMCIHHLPNTRPQMIRV